MPDLTQHTCAYAGRSYLVIHAPMNRTYWFLFKAVEKTLRGKDIPKYSKQQMEDLAQEHMNDKICEKVTFGALYGNRIMSTLVPLEEYVFEKWHYKRIITIGDASHKVNLKSPSSSRPSLMITDRSLVRPRRQWRHRSCCTPSQRSH